GLRRVGAVVDPYADHLRRDHRGEELHVVQAVLVAGGRVDGRPALGRRHEAAPAGRAGVADDAAGERADARLAAGEEADGAGTIAHRSHRGCLARMLSPGRRGSSGGNRRRSANVPLRMVAVAKPSHVAARSGAEYLAALGADDREVWLDGKRVRRPLEHPQLRAGAESIARVFDLQLEHAAEVLGPSPADGRLVNVTHLVPRTRDDLERRRRAFELVAALSGGVMGRTPDYLNVTFACFAGRADVWARRGASELADNLVRYQALLRDADLSCTHAIMNPQVDRTKPEPDQAAGRVALHKVRETADAIVVRGARMLATLAPFADELAVYPGSDIRPQDGRYALAFAIPMATPGLRFVCRTPFSKQGNVFDHPLSSRFDEMDAVATFDDIEIPTEPVFLDGDTSSYNEVTTA